MGFLSRLFNRDRGPKFQIGQTVKCIDDRDHQIKYGKEYVVLHINRQECCGGYAYDVGLSCDGYTHCSCSNTEIPGKGIRWCGEFRFAPVVSAEASAESEESVEIEKPVKISTKEVLKKEIAKVNEN
jgi:hypothetical protein